MVIGGFARRLHKQFSDVEPVRQSAEVILSEAERLEKMVADIEAFCGLPQPIPRPMAGDRLIEGLMRGVADVCQAQSIQVKATTRGAVKDFEADEELLEIALRNIVTNAIEAMPDGGNLELSLDFQPNALVISVKDHGLGITPQDLPNVFDPFFTSKTRGSGLGLTAAHRIVSDHGGEIVIHSAVGQGTEVKIVLPGVGSTPN
jgi:signal transduction histidine kinase